MCTLSGDDRVEQALHYLCTLLPPCASLVCLTVDNCTEVPEIWYSTKYLHSKFYSSVLYILWMLQKEQVTGKVIKLGRWYFCTLAFSINNECGKCNTILVKYLSRKPSFTRLKPNSHVALVVNWKIYKF